MQVRGPHTRLEEKLYKKVEKASDICSAANVIKIMLLVQDLKTQKGLKNYLR